jgi:hypothetical protein
MDAKVEQWSVAGPNPLVPQDKRQIAIESFKCAFAAAPV